MSLLDAFGGLLKQATAGGASEADIHGAYDQVSTAVPQGDLASALTHAFNSDQTPPFEQMLANLFGQSSPEQKAAMLNQVLAAAGPAVIAQVAGSGTLGKILSGGQVTPAQAQQVTPENVQVLAQQAAKQNPSIVDMAAAFYAQHPTLVKTLGAGALALLMTKLSKR